MLVSFAAYALLLLSFGYYLKRLTSMHLVTNLPATFCCVVFFALYSFVPSVVWMTRDTQGPLCRK